MQRFYSTMTNMIFFRDTKNCVFLTVVSREDNRDSRESQEAQDNEQLLKQFATFCHLHLVIIT